MALTEYQLWHRSLARLKATCEQDGTPFAITVDDVMTLKQPTKCPLTNLKLKRSQGHWSANTPTLLMFCKDDGYAIGNVMVASNLAATMMHTLSDGQMQHLYDHLPSYTTIK